MYFKAVRICFAYLKVVELKVILKWGVNNKLWKNIDKIKAWHI